MEFLPAYAMLFLVLFIAVGGYFYFTYKDKK